MIDSIPMPYGWGVACGLRGWLLRLMYLVFGP